MTVSLSIVIPTRDRAERLRETLDELAVQARQGIALEVLVADDGSSDGTPELLQSFHSALPLRVLEAGGRGPAAARNLALRQASAPRVLLLGDDTRPAPGSLAVHLEASNDLALQGRIEWDPTRAITPVMRFLAPEGPQFYFKGLRDGDPIPYWRVLGSNLSAATAWFREEPFDEAFRHAAFEDTELAYRWQRHGWSFVYADQAVCWHDHHYESLEPFLAKQHRAGQAARLALRRHPPLAGRVLLHPLLFGAAVAGRLALSRLTGRSRREDAWDLRVRMAFFRGLLATASPPAP